MPADRLLHPKLGHSAKVSSLSDLAFRVWVAYELAADDYGVMRLSAVTVQAASDALAKRPAKQILAALEQLVTVGLVKTFEHQGRRYAYQETWQNFQRIKHPRDTIQPAPPDALLEQCSHATRQLFTQHPSKKPKDSDPDLGNISETFPQDVGNISEGDRTKKSESGSLARARTRETANGYRLTATGKEGGAGDTPPIDLWARELVNLYPAQGRCGWNMVERPLFDALTADPAVPPAVAWAGLKERLGRQQRSHQWRVKHMIPRLDKWLREGLHLQELPEDAPTVTEAHAKLPAWAQRAVAAKAAQP